MLAILASCCDDLAKDLVAQWSSLDAILLTPASLSQFGWRCDWDGDRSYLVINKEIICSTQLSGVLVLLPWVWPDELTHISASERTYVAAEMTAFLSGWLSSLKCPVINQPTANCLIGPQWRLHHWLQAANKAGLDIVPKRHKVTPGGNELISISSVNELVTVTVVGDACLGVLEDLSIAHSITQIARIAGVTALSAYLGRIDGKLKFCGGSLLPPIDIPEAAMAMYSYFEKGPATQS